MILRKGICVSPSGELELLPQVRFSLVLFTQCVSQTLISTYRFLGVTDARAEADTAVLENIISKGNPPQCHLG